MTNLKCVLCGDTIQKDPINGWELGHNAETVEHGRCCDDCNSFLVIPARMDQLFGKKGVDTHPQESV